MAAAPFRRFDFGELFLSSIFFNSFKIILYGFFEYVYTSNEKILKERK